MGNPVFEKKRNKIAIILLSPILVPLFLIGWALYQIEQSRLPKTKPPQKAINTTAAKKDEIEFYVIPQEQQIEAQ